VVVPSVGEDPTTVVAPVGQDPTLAIPSVAPADTGEPTAAYVAYAAAGPRPGEVDPIGKPPAPVYKKWWFWVIVGVVVLVVIIVAASAGSNNAPNVTTTTTTTPAPGTTMAPPITASPTTAPPTTAPPVTAPPTTTPPTTTSPPTTLPPTTTTPPTTAAPPTGAVGQAVPAGCSPLASSGNCYRAGETCPDADHGVSGTTATEGAVTCEDNDGWRWEPS
jgi:hypothetical protein